MGEYPVAETSAMHPYDHFGTWKHAYLLWESHVVCFYDTVSSWRILRFHEECKVFEEWKIEMPPARSRTSSIAYWCPAYQHDVVFEARVLDTWVRIWKHKAMCIVSECGVCFSFPTRPLSGMKIQCLTRQANVLFNIFPVYKCSIQRLKQIMSQR